MKKTNKVKMGPLGTPLGNPLGYFNSLKAKAKAEPKQTLRKAQNGGDGNDTKIPFVESKDKTYTKVTYTKNPSYSDKDSEMGCGTSIQVPGCDKYGNAGKFRNFSKRLKTIEMPTRIQQPYQELRQLTPSSNTNKKNKN